LGFLEWWWRPVGKSGPSFRFQLRGIRAGFGEVIGERTSTIFRRGGAREAHPQFPVISKGYKSKRVDAAREWFRSGVMLGVNPATIVGPKEYAGTVGFVIEAINRGESPRADKKRYTSEVRFGVPAQCFDAGALLPRDRDVILAAARRTAVTVPVLKYGQRTD